jgi:hypothetical protein
LSAVGADGESSEINDGVKRAVALIESLSLSHIDFPNLGFFTSENVWMMLKQVGLSSQDQAEADNLAAEADTYRNGIVDLTEFDEIVYLIRHNSMQARDPNFESVPADPAIMGIKIARYSGLSKTFGNNFQPYVFLIFGSQAAICFMIVVLESNH